MLYVLLVLLMFMLAFVLVGAFWFVVAFCSELNKTKGWFKLKK